MLCRTAEGDAKFLDLLREAGCQFEVEQLVINVDTVDVIDDLGNAVALDTRLHDLEVAFHDAQYTVEIHAQRSQRFTRGLADAGA